MFGDNNPCLQYGYIICYIALLLGAILQQLKNEEVKKLGEILGIMVQDDYLYVCHHNGVGRLQLHYSWS